MSACLSNSFWDTRSWERSFTPLKHLWIEPLSPIFATGQVKPFPLRQWHHLKQASSYICSIFLCQLLWPNKIIRNHPTAECLFVQLRLQFKYESSYVQRKFILSLQACRHYYITHFLGHLPFLWLGCHCCVTPGIEQYHFLLGFEYFAKNLFSREVRSALSQFPTDNISRSLPFVRFYFDCMICSPKQRNLSNVFWKFSKIKDNIEMCCVIVDSEILFVVFYK